jgi:hypothetical protein
MTMSLEFVEFMPDKIRKGVLYISMKYSTAIHTCACGCGEEVITPLDPARWQLFYDGKTVTLKPSIGNWNFQCRSHYFIINNRVVYCQTTKYRKKKSSIKLPKLSFRKLRQLFGL